MFTTKDKAKAVQEMRGIAAGLLDIASSWEDNSRHYDYVMVDLDEEWYDLEQLYTKMVNFGR